MGLGTNQARQVRDKLIQRTDGKTPKRQDGNKKRKYEYDTEKFTLWIPTNIIKRVKFIALEEGTTSSKITTEALKVFIDKYKK